MRNPATGAETWIVAQAALVPDAGGGPGRVVGIMRNITERKRTEEALRMSEEKYRALFNEMDEAYAVVEVLRGESGRWENFRFLEVNPAFMRHSGMPYPVGLTATELLGTPNYAQLRSS